MTIPHSLLTHEEAAIHALHTHSSLSFTHCPPVKEANPCTPYSFMTIPHSLLTHEEAPIHEALDLWQATAIISCQPGSQAVAVLQDTNGAG